MNALLKACLKRLAKDVDQAARLIATGILLGFGLTAGALIAWNWLTH